MCDAEFHYTYEYQGNAPKLVHTPLTDKCYLTLTQGMHMGLGGNPYGPAGTGKTESVKALGGLFGRQVLVFNCDEVRISYKKLFISYLFSGDFPLFPLHLIFFFLSTVSITYSFSKWYPTPLVLLCLAKRSFFNILFYLFTRCYYFQGIDVKSMGRIFIGLVKCGAWGCFDEFNRLEEAVLSAVSMQIQTIQAALKSKLKSTELLGRTVSLDGLKRLLV